MQHISHNPTAGSSLRPDTPPAYVAVDTSNPEGNKAVRIAEDIITQCSSDQRVNLGELTRVMSMVIKHIQDKEGVILPSLVATAASSPLPSVVATAASSPVNNNPTNPECKDWGFWENRLLGDASKSIRDLKHSALFKITNTLGAHIGFDASKVSAVAKHDLFIQSLKNARIREVDVSNTDIQAAIQSAKAKGNCGVIFQKLFENFETKGNLKPSGIIKAAIALGYLPQDAIDEIYQLAPRQ